MGDGRVEALLETADNRLMHYSPAFASFVEAALPGTEVGYLEVNDGDGLAGVLPFARYRDARLGTVVNSLPFFGSHGGPFVRRDAQDAARELATRFAEVTRDANSVTLIEDPFNPLPDDVIAATGLSVVDDRVGQFTALPTGVADMDGGLMAKLHQKTRNAVRKGQKLDQLVERRDDDAAWAWMQAVHERSIRALGGVPKTLQVFEVLRAAFGDAARLYVGSIDGRPLSGVVVILYRGTVEYFTPVVDESERDSQALSATIFEVMKRLTSDGCTLWNWGGTWRSQEGVYRFKSRWGASDLPYRYLNRVDDALRGVPKEELAAAFPNYYVYRY